MSKCIHKWDYDSLVLDFGKYGVRHRRCMECGISQESDPMTNKWPSEDAITDKQSEPEILSAEELRSIGMGVIALGKSEYVTGEMVTEMQYKTAQAQLAKDKTYYESTIIPARIAEAEERRDEIWTKLAYEANDRHLERQSKAVVEAKAELLAEIEKHTYEINQSNFPEFGLIPIIMLHKEFWQSLKQTHGGVEMDKLAPIKITKTIRVVGHYCKPCEWNKPPIICESIVTADGQLNWPVFAGYKISYCPHCGLILPKVYPVTQSKGGK